MLQTTKSKTQLKIQKLNKKTFGKTTERGTEVWNKTTRVKQKPTTHKKIKS